MVWTRSHTFPRDFRGFRVRQPCTALGRRAVPVKHSQGGVANFGARVRVEGDGEVWMIGVTNFTSGRGRRNVRYVRTPYVPRVRLAQITYSTRDWNNHWLQEPPRKRQQDTGFVQKRLNCDRKTTSRTIWHWKDKRLLLEFAICLRRNLLLINYVSNPSASGIVFNQDSIVRYNSWNSINMFNNYKHIIIML